MSKCSILVLTALASMISLGQIGAFAMIKNPLSQEFNYQEFYLGVLDTLREGGNLIGSIWMIFFPFKKITKAFFLLTCAKIFFLLLMLLGKLMGHERDYFFYFLMIAIGITKISCHFPEFIVNYRLDPYQDAFSMNVWLSVISLGDFIAILLGQVIMHVFNLDWSIFIIIFCIFMFASALIFYMFLEDVPIDEPVDESLSNFEAIQQKVKNMKELLKQPSKLFILLDYLLINNLYYNFLLWFPYYFTVIGYSQYSSYIAILIPFTSFLGTIVFQYSLLLCKSIVDIVIVVSLVVLVGINMWLMVLGKLPETQDNALLYFILVLVMGLLLAGPYGRIGLIEISEECEDDEVVLYYMYALFSLLQCILGLITMFFIGYFMEKDKSSFFVIILINSGLLLVVDLVRRIFFKKQSGGQSSQSISDSL